jgi:hypothetical protein
MVFAAEGTTEASAPEPKATLRMNDLLLVDMVIVLSRMKLMNLGYPITS